VNRGRPFGRVIRCTAAADGDGGSGGQLQVGAMLERAPERIDDASGKGFGRRSSFLGRGGLAAGGRSNAEMFRPLRVPPRIVGSRARSEGKRWALSAVDPRPSPRQPARCRSSRRYAMRARRVVSQLPFGAWSDHAATSPGGVFKIGLPMWQRRGRGTKLVAPQPSPSQVAAVGCHQVARGTCTGALRRCRT